MRLFHSFRAGAMLLAVVGIHGCGDLPDPVIPVTQIQAKTQNLGNGKFMTTLRLPVSTDGTRLQYCEPNGPCLWAIYQHLDRRVSIYKDAYVWHLRLDNPTNHPVSAAWRCTKYQEGYVGRIIGEGGFRIYPTGYTGEPRPGGMGCGYYDPAFRPQWIEVELEWANHDVIAAGQEAVQLEESRRQAAEDHLQIEFAGKIKRLVREVAKFTLAPNFTVAVHSESATIEGGEQNEFANTISYIEFRDRSGSVLHREEFSTKVMNYGNGNYGFADSCSVDLKERVFVSIEPRLIEMRIVCEPSALNFSIVRWYGLDSAGHFRTVQLPPEGFSGALIDRTQQPGLSPGRIYAAINTGYASVVISYIFNRQSFSIAPDLSERFLDVEDGQAFMDQKNLRLKLRSQPSGKVVTTLTLTHASKVRFLRVYVEKTVGNDWLEKAPWTEVEVDGQRGWINLRDDEGLRDALQWAG